MPGVVMFGRRWGFGSDDLALPTSVIALLHAIWYVTLCSTSTYLLLNVVVESCDASEKERRFFLHF